VVRRITSRTMEEIPKNDTYLITIHAQLDLCPWSYLSNCCNYLRSTKSLGCLLLPVYSMSSNHGIQFGERPNISRKTPNDIGKFSNHSRSGNVTTTDPYFHTLMSKHATGGLPLLYWTTFILDGSMILARSIKLVENF